MDTSAVKTNNKTADGKHKKIKAAAVVLCTLSAVLIAFLIGKNALFLNISQSFAIRGEYREAVGYASMSSSAEAELVSDYAYLRVSINENYPDLLAQFSREKLEEWYATVCRISENGQKLDGELLDSVNSIKQTLELIFERIDSYKLIRPDVLSLMDSFNEINRLYTKDENGKNTSFSVKTEYDRIYEWEKQVHTLSQYLASTPNSESIYLFSYMLKEAEAECAQLNDILSTVLSSGYKNDDLVRFSGTTKKTFPDIQNGNVSLNFLEKEEYEKYMYQGLCRSLTENLIVFYNDN